jgi:hypothetical protein
MSGKALNSTHFTNSSKPKRHQFNISINYAVVPTVPIVFIRNSVYVQMAQWYYDNICCLHNPGLLKCKHFQET